MHLEVLLAMHQTLLNPEYLLFLECVQDKHKQRRHKKNVLHLLYEMLQEC
jgi:hypothetical protein